MVLAWRLTLLRRRVIANLDTGHAISGVLYAKRGPLVVFRDARLHHHGQQHPMDGEVVIERRRVTWYQVVS
jgi:hypothetical protein